MTEHHTQRKEQSALDEQTCRASLTLQWLLEKKEDLAEHPITAYNQIEVLVCGEDGFARIAQDLAGASHSIEIACWGFDPGLELTRNAASWPRGPTLGELLEARAAQGVQVRLLVWHDPLGSLKVNNLTGHSEVMPQTRSERIATTGAMAAGPMGAAYTPAYTQRQAIPGSAQDNRHDHCVLWWRRALGGQIPHLEVRLRAGVDKAATASLDSADIAPQDRPSSAAPGATVFANEKSLVESYASHHQKTLLIDYEAEGGRHARGYVMGLNSLTDYWDRSTHLFNDPHRETDWACKSELAQSLKGRQAVALDPYQDYAARITGQALQQVDANFSRAWARARAGRNPLPELRRTQPPAHLAVTGAGCRLQIVRTQPEEQDRSILRAYWQATRSARNYLYIENQYFYYEAWARHLKALRREFMIGVQNAGVGKARANQLHAFIVIPAPEDDGMIPRTYDTVKSLGQAASLPGQDGAMKSEADRYAANYADYEKRLQLWRRSPAAVRWPQPQPPEKPAILQRAQQVQAPESDASGELGERNSQTMKFEGLGLKVLMARMVSFNHLGHEGAIPGLKGGQNYRQVYIHSKLAIVDDCWFTLGSANLNVRSMAADSEINVSVENGKAAEQLRKRVWKLMTGDDALDGGNAAPKEVSDTFKRWKELMGDNKKQFDKGEPPKSGFLIPFTDDRVAMFRHG